MKISIGTTALDIFLFRLESLLKMQHIIANKRESLFSAKSKDEQKKLTQLLVVMMVILRMSDWRWRYLKNVI